MFGYFEEMCNRNGYVKWINCVIRISWKKTHDNQNISVVTSYLRQQQDLSINITVKVTWITIKLYCIVNKWNI